MQISQQQIDYKALLNPLTGDEAVEKLKFLEAKKQYPPRFSLEVVRLSPNVEPFLLTKVLVNGFDTQQVKEIFCCSSGE